MATDFTMPASRKFQFPSNARHAFARVETLQHAAFSACAEKNLDEGVYTKEMAPYNLLSLLIAEPPKQAKVL